MEQDYPLELPLTNPPGKPLVNDLLAGETLLRLHPHWFVDAFDQDGDRVTTELRDYATESAFRLAYGVAIDRDGLPTLVFSEATRSLECR